MWFLDLIYLSILMVHISLNLSFGKDILSLRKLCTYTILQSSTFKKKFHTKFIILYLRNKRSWIHQKQWILLKPQRINKERHCSVMEVDIWFKICWKLYVSTYRWYNVYLKLFHSFVYIWNALCYNVVHADPELRFWMTRRKGLQEYFKLVFDIWLMKYFPIISPNFSPPNSFPPPSALFLLLLHIQCVK